MFRCITDDAILPQAQTKHSAGFDVYANEDIVIEAGETKIVPLGIGLDIAEDKSDIFKDCFFGLYLRSSYGARGLILPNGVGIIDIDYKDEIGQIIHNPIRGYWKGADGSDCFLGVDNELFVTIKKGDRVGQLILQKHYGIELIGNDYRKDVQRDGGFGSTN